MKPLYCNKGHENPTGTRFCQHCGEKLDLFNAHNVVPGSVLGDRYCVVRELGQGGFGRTYLAVDVNRFNEPCVLKEFAPQVQGSYALQKALELFEREAGVLYKLQHPQIPRFREIFRVDNQGIERLFLVQDYIDGQTYRNLLEVRTLQGAKFSEAEVYQLLLQTLPVLDYIHSLGVIHRDISPDNLMLRKVDNLPVLIDFGGVKQVAATVVSQLNQPSPAVATTAISTRIGKVGYAPEEQMQRGVVFPHSDLYALAVTMLVLLTGKEPHQLIDPQSITWAWRREVNLSPKLGDVLHKMLQPQPSDRYQSATQVLQALLGHLPTAHYSPPVTPDEPPPTAATVAVAPSPHQQEEPEGKPLNTPVTPAIEKPVHRVFGLFGKILLVCLLLAGAGGIGWWAGNHFIASQVKPTPKPSDENLVPSFPPPLDEEPQFNDEERQRKQALRQRRTQLGLGEKFYVDLVNQVFWVQTPSQRGRQLTNRPEDQQLRVAWDKIAAELLGKLEQANFSAETRQAIGSYSAADRDRWRTQVNQQRLSSRALIDLTDNQYLYLLPEYSAKKLNLSFEAFLKTPLGQVWQGMMAQKLKAIQSGQALEIIRFDSGETTQQVSGTLNPGEGKAYIAQISAGQLMNFKLETPAKTLLSIYPPTSQFSALLEDSSEKTWSGKLPQSGYYEFVVVPQAASGAISYKLNLSVENPATPSSSEPSAPDPLE